MDLSAKQHQLMDRIASDHNITDYQVIAEPGSIRGENFLGVITNISIKSNETHLELILKAAQTTEAMRKEDTLRKLYEREIFLYERIFEEFKKFQNDYNILDPFISTPISYAFSSEDRQECIIMENLKSTGYQLWNKKIPMNPNHIKAVLKEYAKFHATSLAMKEKNPTLYEELTKPIAQQAFDNNALLEDHERLAKYFKRITVNAHKAVKDYQSLTECLQRFETELLNFFTIEAKKPEYKLVVVHGDCWCNNFLFKYEDSNNSITPSSLKIIDWQLSYHSTPAVDLCYFLLVNSDKDIYDNFKIYIKFYYDSLSTQLYNFKCDPEKIFPYSTLEDHIKMFMKFGLYMSVSIIKLMVCDSEEAPDFAESAEQDKLETCMDFEIKNYDEYKRRMINLIDFINKSKFI